MDRSLCVSPVLRSPNFTQPFIVQTDASDQGGRGVHSQQDENGEEHPVAFFSQKLLQREEHNSTVEEELQARLPHASAWEAICHPNQPLVICVIGRNEGKQTGLTRWILALQQYQFSVECKCERMNINADMLCPECQTLRSLIQSRWSQKGERSVGDHRVLDLRDVLYLHSAFRLLFVYLTLLFM